MKAKKLKVLVGMSGGVDSSVAAFLLKNQGFEVSGVFIDFIGEKKSENDFQKAQEIANKLGIPIYKLGIQNEFREKIIDKFIKDYKEGITPNPCVMCNPEMKFKILIAEADKKGIELVATGHYARICKLKIKNEKLKIEKEKKDLMGLLVTNHQLLIAKDESKDQSYFLYRLTQNQLDRIIFPLGEYLKSEVRKIAGENNFKIKNEEESQDVCFISNNDFVKFISSKIKNNPGDIIDLNGNKLGEHQGLHFYTIGQRKGINLGGDGPYYVIKKNPSTNQLVVSNKQDDARIFGEEFKIRDTNWIKVDLSFPFRAKVKIRYRGPEEYAIINKEKDDIFQVRFEKYQKSITPGQSAVFYGEAGEVFGGGIII